MLKKSKNQTQKYKVITIYGGSHVGKDAISDIEGGCGYLHIHIIREDVLKKIPTIDVSAIENYTESSTIYQWGLSVDKDLGTRKAIVALRDILKYGNIGLGSAAIGEGEEKSNFVGGGEVMIIPDKNGVKALRITKGQGVFPLSLNDECWICEVAKSEQSLTDISPEISYQINSRQELLKLLQSIHKNGEKPFIAMFDAHFEKEKLAVRSNGILPHDKVEERDVTLFTAADFDPIGGHLLGDSESEGDALEKHKGKKLKSANVSLTINAGSLQITIIEKKLIASDANPNQFRKPLLQVELQKELKINSDHYRAVVINGGGISGVTTALKLAKIGIPSTIIEQRSKILSGTSGVTPGRLGHGFHYRDLETAKLYLQSSITFAKEYYSKKEKQNNLLISLQESSELDRGLYFISKDSQIPAEELLKVYEGIRQEYKRLVELDIANKVFGEVDKFFEILDLAEFKDCVDIDKMAAVIRTQERLLNWVEFERFLSKKLEFYKEKNLISILTNHQVTQVEYDEDAIDQRFSLKILHEKEQKEITTAHFINATWENIEILDSGLFSEAAVEERTNRIKLIANIELPKSAYNIPSMFTTMGPYSMFSNEGNGKAKTTYAPVTNIIDYVTEQFKAEKIDVRLQKIWNKWKGNGDIPKNCTPDNSLRNLERQLEIPQLHKRWLLEGLNEEEKSFFGERILAGSIANYPILAGAKLVNVGAGIVKSNGEVNIRDVSSKFHERNDSGIRERHIGYISFNGVKLFYVESQARCVAKMIIDNIRSNIEIKRSLIDIRKSLSSAVHKTRNAQIEFLPTYDRYHVTKQVISAWKENLEYSLESAGKTNDKEYLYYIRDAVNSTLSLYLKNSESTLNILSHNMQLVVKSIGSTVKEILQNSYSEDPKYLQEKQQLINEDLKKYPKLFTVFSVADEGGNIMVDGRYGIVNEEVRKRYNIPSLAERDYVKKMISNEGSEFFCGNPVIGSTSKEYMIPAGIRLNSNRYITFGMSIKRLSEIIAP